jgi:hypothetical protein
VAGRADAGTTADSADLKPTHPGRQLHNQFCRGASASTSTGERSSRTAFHHAQVHEAGFGCAGLVRWAGDAERQLLRVWHAVGNRAAGLMVDCLKSVVCAAVV